MFSYSKQHRLVSKQDFQAVFAKPYKVSHKYLLVLCHSNQSHHSRLGVIAGKRYIKQAVNRNVLRRIIRESFRHIKESLQGLDIVVVVRSECIPQDKKILRNDADNLWQVLTNSLQSR